MKHATAAVAEVLGDGGATAGLTPTWWAGSSRPGRTSALIPSSVSSRYIKTAYGIHALQMGYLRSTPFGFRKLNGSGPPSRSFASTTAGKIARVLALMMASDVTRKEGWSQWRARRLHALAATVRPCRHASDGGDYLKVEDVLLDERMILISRPKTA